MVCQICVLCRCEPVLCARVHKKLREFKSKNATAGSLRFFKMHVAGMRDNVYMCGLSDLRLACVFLCVAEKSVRKKCACKIV